MWRCAKMQMSVLMKRKSAVIVYFLLLIIVMNNYFSNLNQYFGWDVSEMYHPVKILFLATYSRYHVSFLQYFPLLVVIPAAFCFLNDRNTRELIFIQSRVGSKNYYFGTAIAVFLVTMAVFSIPFLIEIPLNYFVYPTKAIGEPSNVALYEDVYISSVKNYFFSTFYAYYPYLYSVFCILIFGAVAGILAVFAYTISTFAFVKFKIIVFLPVYVLLQCLNLIEINYIHYLQMFDGSEKMEWVMSFYVCCLLYFLFPF